MVFLAKQLEGVRVEWISRISGGKEVINGETVAVEVREG